MEFLAWETEWIMKDSNISRLAEREMNLILDIYPFTRFVERLCGCVHSAMRNMSCTGQKDEGCSFTRSLAIDHTKSRGWGWGFSYPI